MALILKQEANANVTTPSTGSGTVFLNGSDQLTVKDSTGNISTVPTFTATGNSEVFYNDNGALGYSANMTFDNTTNTFAVTNANVNTLGFGSGSISGTGNITGGNLIGTIAAGSNNITTTGNVTGGNIIGPVRAGSNTITTTGNANVGNLGFGTGVITGTGNITGGNIIGTIAAGSNTITTTGNANVGNIGGTTAIFTTGNITTVNTGLIQNGLTNVTVAVGGNVSTFVNGNTTPQMVIASGGANIPGYANIGGNLSSGNANLGNLASANYFSGNGSSLSSLTGANVSGQVNYAATANSVAGANVSGAVSYATTANSVAGANVTGAVAYATTANSVAGANVTGAVAYATTANSVAGGNVTGQVSNSLVAGTVYTNAQPNITSVGTLSSLAVTGTITGGNANVTGQLISTVSTGTAPLVVSSTTVVTNLNADLLDGYNTATANTASTIAVRDTNGNLNANYFIGNGSQLTGIDATSIQNGTANVRTFLNANVAISAGGNSNVVVVTDTGANIAGTANITGITNLGSNLNVTSNILGNFVLANANVVANNIQANSNITANLNLIANGKIYIGSGATATGFTNPVILAKVSGDEYIQAGLINANNTASADWVAYGDNGNDVAGWTDMGFTGSNYNDANFTITGKNDGYLFVQAVNGAGLGGNLVLATGDQGSTNDIVFATGGFLSTNEVMRFSNAQQQLQIEPNTISTSTTTGALIVAGGAGIVGNLYVGGTINGNISGNISGNIVIPGSNTGVVFNDNGNANTSTGFTFNKTTGLVSVTGNLTSGNADLGNLAKASYLQGTLTTASQPNVTSVGTLSSLAVTANVTAGNVYANSGTVGAANLTGTLTTAAQPNVTSVGTLTSLGVNGTVTAVNITANTGVFTGNGNGLSSLVGANVTGQVNYAATANAVAGANVTGQVNYAATANSVAGANVSGAVAYATTANSVAGANVSGAVAYATTANAVAGSNVSGQVGNALVAGTVYTNAQPNITSTGTLTSLGVSGTVTAVNVTANTGVFTGNGNGLSSLVGANVTGQVGNALIAGTVYTNAQPNITSVGTLTSLSVTGNISAGNVNAGNLLTANYSTSV